MSRLIPDWRIYERLVAAIQSENASGELTVVPNVRLRGSISGRMRQVDVLIDARLEEDVARRTIVDAKLRSRPINIKDVEAFEGMMRDCRADRGVIACNSGYTAAAKRRAQQTITISLVPSDQIEEIDLSQWELCLGGCNGSGLSRHQSGWVLYDQVFALGSPFSLVSIIGVGKCDRCHDFHVWCWDCGLRIVLMGDEAEAKCDCDRFWLTALESEGRDERGNELESVLLLLVHLPVGPWQVVDRRPLG
jgi:hypothetical protein